MASKFNHPGTKFEVTKKNNKVYVDVVASWVSNSDLSTRILLTTRKVKRILARHYDFGDLKVVKEDHVTNLNDNSEKERTGQWIFSLPEETTKVDKIAPARQKSPRTKKSTNLTK